MVHSLQLGPVTADYHIGFRLNSIEFLEPQNTLADGSCCDPGCRDNTMSCCAATNITCKPTLRLCFREPQHPMEDEESSCLLLISRQSVDGFVAIGSTNPSIKQYYSVSWKHLYCSYVFQEPCLHGTTTRSGFESGLRTT